VRLPTTGEPDAALAPPSKPTVAARRVLVVEDDADTRDMLRSILQLSGHEVFEAKDGEQGIEAGLRLAPDVVLVDLGMPRADGFEVARRLREPLADALLVAVTGYGQAEDRRRSTEAGFDVHLVKPVDPSELADILGNARRAVRAPGA
jgi:CheY-like chemotaxis protein